MNVCKFSQDRKYRYRLDFALEGLAPRDERIAWILLNPSTADEQRLDPTLTRVKGYAERLGIRNVTILNLFAWRATDPRALLGPLGRPRRRRGIYPRAYLVAGRRPTAGEEE